MLVSLIGVKYAAIIGFVLLYGVVVAAITVVETVFEQRRFVASILWADFCQQLLNKSTGLPNNLQQYTDQLPDVSFAAHVHAVVRRNDFRQLYPAQLFT